MNRRQLLKLGTTAGALSGAGLVARHVLLPPAPSAVLEPVPTLAKRLFEALLPEARELACVPYDHPLRQYHNRGVRGGGVPIDGSHFPREQRGILTDLLHSGVSAAGRARVPEQFFLDWLGVHQLNLLICGDPASPPYQLVLTGPHLNLRLGGRSAEGAAFGGPLVYGDQRGNERQGLPGNVYRYQFRTADRLFRSLTSEQREHALLPVAPPQTQIDVQGSSGSFPGVPIAGLSSASKDIAHELVDGILSTFCDEDVAYGWECLERNRGVAGLSVSYYEEGEVDGSGEYQVFRLEGPAAVFHFLGVPHVHAFVNVAWDGDTPLSVGEELGRNPRVLEGGAVKALFERSMKDRTGADLGYYDAGAVAGRLRAGTIRTGDIYSLESWGDHVTVVEIRGARFREAVARELEARGIELLPDRLYSVATTGHVAENASQCLGEVVSRQPVVMLREATIGYLKRTGFGA